MNINIEKSTPKVGKYKFNDHFLKKFEKMSKMYDEQLKRLRSIEKEIDDISHGICNTGYNLRYITPSDISTFVSNFDTALSQGLLNPNMSDCNMFAVAAAIKFMNDNKCVNFVNTTVSGNKQPVPKTATLQDLEMYVGHETFKREVYTKYEMSHRIKCIKDDIKKLDDMHFTAATRSLVNKLPDIITKHSEVACSACDIKSQEIFGMFVAHFIGFAIKLNLSTVVQMIKYASPGVTFNTIEDKEMKVTASTVQEFAQLYGEREKVITESVNLKDKKPVFFVFTEGVGFPLSNMIKSITKSKFSHMAIGFDSDLKKIYTYGPRGEHRENYTSGEVGVGFLVESVEDLKRKNIKMSVMCGFVDNDSVKKMQDEVTDFARHRTTFDFRMFERFLVKKDKKPSKNKYAQVCSTFCDYIMEVGNIKATNKELSSPADIKNAIDEKAETLNNVFEVFYGNSNDYVVDTANIKIDNFAVQTQTRAFDEYYTECFHITKINSEIRSRIPFGCNFRDIVLGDDHEFYKNTECALKYIITSPKSPFNQLIVQYAPDGNECDVSYDVDSIMRIFFGNMHDVDYNNPYNRPDVQFPSDPNWMDKIACGNAYYDLNYRKDNPGNHHSDPITGKFDMVYKLYGHVYHETDSKKLVANIRKIVKIMESIISSRKYSTEIQMPRQLSTEVLALFGEILTKTLMKLYHLNTVVLDFSDTMDETMIPGYMYEESYVENENGNIVQESYIIMEADEKADDMPKVTAIEMKDAKVSNANVKDMKAAAKAKHSLSGLIRKVIDWVSNTVGKAFNNWEKAYKKIIDYVEASTTAKLVEEIATALDNRTFNITIDNYVKYKVQVNAFSNIKPETAVNDIINKYGKEQANGKSVDLISEEDLAKFESALYPSGIYDQIKNINTKSTDGTDQANNTANAATIKNRGDAVRNYFLFGDIKEPELKSIDLKGGDFKDIYENIKNTRNCESPFTKLTESFKKALTAIDTAKNEVDVNGTHEQADNMKSETKVDENMTLKNLGTIFNITQRASQATNAAAIDALVGIPTKSTGYDAFKKSFWGKNYSMFKAVIDEYKTRDKDFKPGEENNNNNANQDAANADATKTQSNTQHVQSADITGSAEVDASGALQTGGNPV